MRTILAIPGSDGAPRTHAVLDGVGPRGGRLAEVSASDNRSADGTLRLTRRAVAFRYLPITCRAGDEVWNAGDRQAFPGALAVLARWRPGWFRRPSPRPAGDERDEVGA